jgi:clostripain
MNKKRLPFFIIIVVLGSILLTSIACSLFEDTPTPTSAPAAEPTQAAEAPVLAETPEIVETTEPAAANTEKGDTWLVMMYSDADDPVLEEDVFTDLNEAERVGSSDKVTIVAQIDRYDGEFQGKQDFTSTKRFLLTQDDDLEVINSEEIADLGELNMADSKTLVDFATWAIETYPADHHVLIMSDHGTGWSGGWTDPSPANKSNTFLISGFDDMLFLSELDDAYAQIVDRTGIGKFDIIGYDACLMASLEVLSATAPYADYAVLSQEVEPAMGWAYASFLQKLVDKPGMSGADLAKGIVKSYIVEDSVVVDDEVRAKYIATYYDGKISPEELKKDLVKTVTLSAIDLSVLPDLLKSVDNLALAMNKINQKMVARARTHSRSFETIYSEDEPSPFIDLGHFAKMIAKESTSPNITKAVDEVKAAMKDAVIAEMHGSSLKSSTGISIYFPTSNLFEEDGSDYATYSKIANRFSEESLWDDFLVSHYTGKPLNTGNKPAKGTKMTGPGASEIKLDPIELSSDTASEGNPATMSSVITGENISYIYIFTGRFNPDDSVQIVDIDYIDAEAVIEVDGTTYPDWGGKEVPIDFDWEPLEYFVTDGSASVPALLEPDTYGVSTEDTIYTVEGIFVLSQDKTRHFARVSFDGDGNLIKVMGFNDEEDNGPQHEITLQEGDQFIILDKSISTDKNSNREYHFKEAGKLTFDGTPWTWDVQTAQAGDYVVGFIAEDMDGNRYEQFAEITAE